MIALLIIKIFFTACSSVGWRFRRQPTSERTQLFVEGHLDRCGVVAGRHLRDVRTRGHHSTCRAGTIPYDRVAALIDDFIDQRAYERTLDVIDLKLHVPALGDCETDRRRRVERIRIVLLESE